METSNIHTVSKFEIKKELRILGHTHQIVQDPDDMDRSGLRNISFYIIIFLRLTTQEKFLSLLLLHCTELLC